MMIRPRLVFTSLWTGLLGMSLLFPSQAAVAVTPQQQPSPSASVPGATTPQQPQGSSAQEEAVRRTLDTAGNVAQIADSALVLADRMRGIDALRDINETLRAIQRDLQACCQQQRATPPPIPPPGTSRPGPAWYWFSSAMLAACIYCSAYTLGRQWVKGCTALGASARSESHATLTDKLR